MGAQPSFGRHRRRITPFAIPDHPGEGADQAALAEYARAKAAALNMHVIGHGALAEGEWNAAGLAAPDLARMRRYRLERIRAELRRRDLAGIHLYDPLNVRYATDVTNMQLWTLHNPVRAAWVPVEGPVVLFDFHHCEHLSDHSEVVDEVRGGTAWFWFESGPRSFEKARDWAAEVADLTALAAGSAAGARVAFDQIDAHGVDPIRSHGIEIVYGEEVMEEARKVKGADEIAAQRRAVHACERAMGAMEDALVPGMSENDLWAVLHAENIRRGGEWIETRLLSSGPRTNPWFQESSSRVIDAGDLVAFDTDLVGPYGQCCDISRTWLAGPGRPTNEQRHLYAMAAEQIAFNRDLLRPGVSFRELTFSARTLPEDCVPNRYGVLFHGVGLCDEYPSIRYPQDWDETGYDGVLEPGMVICVESYVGRHGGHEGVKLEEQCLVTKTGHEQLSTYPLDERLMG